jgi:hypothetical protein
MVGDGVNDTSALMQADVDIAMGHGTDIAIDAADIIILNNRLDAVVTAREISRRSYRKMVENVSLAFLFNGIGVPLAATGLIYRICRPVGLSPEDGGRVVDYMLARLGNRYDLKNVFDLARYLLPTPPVPMRWRRRMLSLGSSDPTRAICSTLIAQAFQSVGFPILPVISAEAASVPDCRDCMREIYHIRRHNLFVPRDFDVSPYFSVIKPLVSHAVDYRTLTWAEVDQIVSS